MSELLVKRKTQVEQHVAKIAGEAGGVFKKRYGLWLLAMISFVESALIVPIITDPFLVAYILVNKTKALRAFFITTTASVAGGVVAYATAALVIEVIFSTFFSSVSVEELHQMAGRFKEGTFIITILGAITPVPYTIVALAAGSVKASLPVFILASFLGRGFRYAIVTYLTFKFGERALIEIQKRIWPTTIAVIILISIYLWFKI